MSPNFKWTGNACVTTWPTIHGLARIDGRLFTYISVFSTNIYKVFLSYHIFSVMRNRIKTTSTGVAKSPVDSFLATHACATPIDTTAQWYVDATR